MLNSGYLLEVVQERVEESSGFAGQQRVILPEWVLSKAIEQQPLLKGLVAAGAGYFPKAAGHSRNRPRGIHQAIFIYCVSGSGWADVSGHTHPVRPGDLLAIPPNTPHRYGTHNSKPWTIRWVYASGEHLRRYFEELGITVQAPVVEIGEDVQLAPLFNEIVSALERSFSLVNLLHASNTLAHLLSVFIRNRHEERRTASDVVAKVAQTIIYMSEHLDQPLRVSSLAALAGISAAHFTVLFKEQTGSSPKDYLQLLRIHRACQLLHGTELSVKEISARLGYQDQFHFSRQFKAFQGVSPTEYRNAHGAIPPNRV